MFTQEFKCVSDLGSMLYAYLGTLSRLAYEEFELICPLSCYILVTKLEDQSFQLWSEMVSVS